MYFTFYQASCLCPQNWTKFGMVLQGTPKLFDLWKLLLHLKMWVYKASRGFLGLHKHQLNNQGKQYSYVVQNTHTFFAEVVRGIATVPAWGGWHMVLLISSSQTQLCTQSSNSSTSNHFLGMAWQMEKEIKRKQTFLFFEFNTRQEGFSEETDKGGVI